MSDYDRERANRVSERMFYAGVEARQKQAEKEEQRQREEELLKKQFKHDRRMAILNGAIALITGAVSGFMASVIYNIIIGK